MSFLPDGYSTPKTSGGYLKLEDGDNRIRILDKPTIGFKYQDNDGNWKFFKQCPNVNKSEIKVDNYGNQRVIHFWILPVWDYKTKSILNWEINQTSIQSQIEDLANDEEWGSPTEYDIKIKKEKTNIVEYAVTPAPKKELADEIKTELEGKKFDYSSKFTEQTLPQATAALGQEIHQEEPHEEIKIYDLPF